MTDGVPRLENQEREQMDLEAVMDMHQAALLRYATRVLNNADAAQDVVQEAFIRLHDKWDGIMGRTAELKSWLYRTTHNAAVDYIRKESRLRLLHERQFKQNGSYPEFGVDHEQDERQALVLRHLNALKPKEREVLVLRLQEGMSYREIADVINRTEGYVGTLIHTATKKLTQCLRQAGVVT